MPEDEGFWLDVEASRQVKYRIRYFALGKAAYQRQGEVSGTVGKQHYRRFVNLGFPVVVVGISDLQLSAGTKLIRGYEVPLVLGQPRPLLVPSFSPIAGRGRIELSAAARRKRTDGFDTTYGTYGLYGMYGGIYGAYGVHGGVSEKPKKSKRRKGRPKKGSKKRRK
jgi:hypothetical protein